MNAFLLLFISAVSAEIMLVRKVQGLLTNNIPFKPLRKVLNGI